MHSAPHTTNGSSSRFARLRRSVFEKMASLGHAVVDMAVADELEDGQKRPGDEVRRPAGIGLGYEMAPGAGADAYAGDDMDLSDEDLGLHMLGGPLPNQRSVRLNGGLRAVPMKSREYPLALVPPEPNLMGLKRYLKVVDGEGDDAGKKFLVLDKLEAAPEVIAMLENREVLPGHTVTLSNRPHVIFRPELLSIEKELASFYAIVDIRVGKNSQMAAAGDVMAEDFAAGTPKGRLRCDAAQIAMDVAIILRNISDKPQRAPRATFYGPAIE